MKIVTILSLLFLASPAFAQLTKEDMRTIMKEENAASEKRIKEYIDLKIDGVEKSLNARIDGLEKSVNSRFDAVNSRIDGLEKSVDSRFDAVNSRFDAVDKSLDRMWWLMIGFIGLITAAIAVPQIIVAYRERGQKELEKRQEDLQTEIQQLREQIESMQTPSS